MKSDRHKILNESSSKEEELEIDLKYCVNKPVTKCSLSMLSIDRKPFPVSDITEDGPLQQRQKNIHVPNIV